MTSTPLPERICHALMQAGILGPDGELPKCLGPSCDQFEECLGKLIASRIILDYLQGGNQEQVRRDILKSFRGGK